MTSTADPGRMKPRERAESLLTRVLNEITRPGMHCERNVVLKVRDGVIYNVEVHNKEIHKTDV